MTNEPEVEHPRARRQNRDDAGQQEVQERVDEENEKGYVGTVPDQTPNENYTVAGNDLPTPETDPDMAAEQRKHALDLEREIK